MKNRLYTTKMTQHVLMGGMLVCVASCQSTYQTLGDTDKAEQDATKAASIRRGTAVAPGTKASSAGMTASAGSRFVVPTPPAANPRNNSTYLPEISDEDLDIGAWDTVSTVVPVQTPDAAETDAALSPSSSVEDLDVVLDQVTSRQSANAPSAVVSGAPSQPMSAAQTGYIASNGTSDAQLRNGSDLWEEKQQQQPLSAASTAVMSGGYAVHIASYRQEANVRIGWATLSRNYSGLLGGLQPVYSQKHIHNRGTFLRLKAGPFSDRTSARQVCEVLQRNGDFCSVVMFEGAPL